jgi:glycerol-3-phosphate dehydrogenase (NAD(P)+)
MFSRRGPDKAARQPGVEAVDSLSEIGRRGRLILLAVPSEIVGSLARDLGGHLDGRHLLVHASRGLNPDDLAPISEVLRRETPTRRVGALGGPVQADDLAHGRPSVLVVGSAFPEVNEAVLSAFGGDTVRVYTTSDVHGVELASALMGCLAVGVGYAQRLGLNPGIVATLITRGVEESARIAAAAGANERTLLGLAGYGDLLAAIAQKDRPEVVFGAALAEGKPVDVALQAAKLRVEAATLIPRVAAWADARAIVSPIFQGLSMRMRERIEPAELVERLMRSPRQTLD